MQFRDIPGHDYEKARLMNMVDTNTLPHALLLDGGQGRGKLALALALATYIHCTDRIEGVDSCGECESCRMYRSLNHVDTLLSFPVIKRTENPVSDDFLAEFRSFVAESHFADIEAWSAILNRSKTNTRPVIYVSESVDLIHKLAVTPKISGYKIVIQWLPELMNEAAANKLLKVVEEPFADTLFIMVSNAGDRLLPTIRSRTQRVVIPALTEAEIARWLSETKGMDPQDAISVAHLAEGDVVSAVQLLSAHSVRRHNFELFKSLMRLAYKRDVGALREWAAGLAAEGRDRQMKFYEFAMRMVRENFVYNFSRPDLVFLDREEADFSKNFARFISEQNVERLMTTFQEAYDDIAANGNAKIINLDVAIQVIFHIKNA